MTRHEDPLQPTPPSIPRPFIDRVNERAQDKAIEEIIENPLALLDRLNTGIDLITRVLPTLPGETMIPMPRGLYEKLKESGSLPSGDQHEGK